MEQNYNFINNKYWVIQNETKLKACVWWCVTSVAIVCVIQVYLKKAEAPKSIASKQSEPCVYKICYLQGLSLRIKLKCCNWNKFRYINSNHFHRVNKDPSAKGKEKQNPNKYACVCVSSWTIVSPESL